MLQVCCQEAGRAGAAASVHDYHDPVEVTHPEYSGSWTAGFAPVGNTGFVGVGHLERAADDSLHLLLAAWRAGEAAAGDRLFVRHFPAVDRFFRNKASVRDIPDLVQQTFVRCCSP